MASDLDARFQDLVSLLHSIPSSIFNIGADILVPKRPCQLSRLPVIVRIHGGFLVTGSSLFPAWFSKWILEFAEEQSAVIISPNYRLLPEVKGMDIIQDMKNFWDWFQRDGPERCLRSVGRSEIRLDPEQLLLVGESAGGYLALQSALMEFVRPRAMIVLYPMLDMLSDHFATPYSKTIAGVPNFPPSVVDNFLADLPERTVITEADPPARLDLALAVVQNGRLLDILGDSPDLFILEKLKHRTVAVSRDIHESLFPHLYILHGEQDSAVPVDGTLKLVEYVKNIDPAAKIHTAIQPGDHGFDCTASSKDKWMREGLDFVLKEWIRQDSKI
ncbi:alpha/beta-hydrolase [Trichoderma asperelloides]|nr:alpha/beta-hydrolase [Trichoderma asperelloides]